MKTFENSGELKQSYCLEEVKRRAAESICFMFACFRWMMDLILTEFGNIHTLICLHIKVAYLTAVILL